MGLMITGGFSPLPTEAPGFVGIPSIPKELRRRQDFPVNWCGFIDGTIGRDNITREGFVMAIC